MPADSSWNTPVVSPEASSSNVVASSSGMWSRSIVDAAVARGSRSTAWRRIVRLDRPEEVELEQAQRLDAVHLVLGHQRVRVGRLLERHQLGQRLAADDHAGGVGRGVAGDALELLGEVDEPLDLPGRASYISRERRRDLERLVELDAELVGDGLGDPVDLAVAEARARARRRGSRPGRASCRR